MEREIGGRLNWAKDRDTFWRENDRQQHEAGGLRLRPWLDLRLRLRLRRGLLRCGGVDPRRGSLVRDDHPVTASTPCALKLVDADGVLHTYFFVRRVQIPASVWMRSFGLFSGRAARC